MEDDEDDAYSDNDDSMSAEKRVCTHLGRNRLGNVTSIWDEDADEWG
jgi:hypothetical protein